MFMSQLCSSNTISDFCWNSENYILVICNTDFSFFFLFCHTHLLCKHTPRSHAGDPEPRFGCDHNRGWYDCGQEWLPHPALCCSHSR